jgi:hypothetical protein
LIFSSASRFICSFICEYSLKTFASTCRTIWVTHSSATPPARAGWRVCRSQIVNPKIRNSRELQSLVPDGTNPVSSIRFSVDPQKCCARLEAGLHFVICGLQGKRPKLLPFPASASRWQRSCMSQIAEGLQ